MMKAKVGKEREQEPWQNQCARNVQTVLGIVRFWATAPTVVPAAHAGKHLRITARQREDRSRRVSWDFLVLATEIQ